MAVLVLSSAGGQQFEEVCWVYGVILPAIFLTLEVYKYWRLGKSALIIVSAVLTVRCSLLISDLVDEPNQTVIDKHRT